MKKMIILLALISTNAFAAHSRDMSWVCQETLITALGEGTLEMSTPEIIRELKADWTLNFSNKTADFGYCGNSEFFSIKVDKSTCEIVELEGGDSDGDCHE